jgi:two-component system, cell cycle sensor histidine kinase and response regulator CckA
VTTLRAARVRIPAIAGATLKALGKRLKALRPKLSVLFTSGYPLDIIAQRGVLESGIAYIPKPFRPDELAAKVREALTVTPAPR